MPLFQIPEPKCRVRSNFFVQQLVDVQSLPNGDFYKNYNIEEAAALATAEAYYLLHDAYKAKRQIPDDHKTEFSKVAAFTALTIGYLCPLRHKDLHRDSNIEDQMVNPMFGLRLAMIRVGADIETLKHEEQDRLYEGFRGFTFPTLEKYHSALQFGSRKIFDPFDIEFSAAEMIFIEDKITIFALCERQSKVA